ncbi:hypothetical protein [Salinisphaera sp. PC39]|uniref:hypothetical protein n=1 Tax=Salinisphaera sp. PC39 TaxID=1304156 RepID=UPI00333FE701
MTHRTNTDETGNSPYCIPWSGGNPQFPNPEAQSGVTDQGRFWILENEVTTWAYVDEQSCAGPSGLQVHTDAGFSTNANPALANALIRLLGGNDTIDCSEGASIEYENHRVFMDYSNPGSYTIPEVVFTNEVMITGDNDHCTEFLQLVGPVTTVDLGRPYPPED